MLRFGHSEVAYAGNYNILAAGLQIEQLHGV